MCHRSPPILSSFVTDLDGPLEVLTKAIDEALAQPDCRLETAGLTDEEVAATSWVEREAVAEQVRGVPDAANPLALGSAELEMRTIFAVALTLAACLAVLGFAAVTVEEAVYRDNHIFAGFDDYFTLFSAALASGAAAGVLSLLAYWRPDPVATTS